MVQADERAFQEFFKLYYHRLLAYLLVVTRGDEQLAGELLQQTLIKVARHVRVFRDEALFWRWLAALARTSAIDESRKARRYRGFLDRFWKAKPLEPEWSAREMLFGSLVGEALAELEPEERILLEKKYLEGWSVSELAVLLSSTEKAVESRLTRIRVKVKERTLKGLHNERSPK